MNNEAKERLKYLTRKLADASFAKACDPSASDEEFRDAMSALENHIREVRKRAMGLFLAKELV